MWLIFRVLYLILLEYTMIKKAVGYGGFKSYSECPYSSGKIDKYSH